MTRTASGRRMITTDISLSAKVASLSPESLALFCLLIPHFNSHGKMLANPYAIKGTVAPLIEWLTVEKIGVCLAEISEKTNVKWWRDAKGLHYLQSLNWGEHQELRADRLGADRLPDYPGDDRNGPSSLESTPGELPDHSRSKSGPLPPEVEVEVEVEEEEGPICSEPVSGSKPNAPPITPLLEIPTNRKGEVFVLSQEQVDEWEPIYPAVDVVQEIRRAMAWLDAKPTRRKTSRGMKAFLVGWLNRSQDRGGSRVPTDNGNGLYAGRVVE